MPGAHSPANGYPKRKSFCRAKQRLARYGIFASHLFCFFLSAYSHFGCGAVTALLRCRDLLPGRLRFGFMPARSFSIAGTFQILPPGNVQINLTLPPLIRTLAAPKILRLGKNASELAFFSRLIRIFAGTETVPMLYVAKYSQDQDRRTARDLLRRNSPPRI